VDLIFDYFANFNIIYVTGIISARQNRVDFFIFMRELSVTTKLNEGNLGVARTCPHGLSVADEGRHLRWLRAVSAAKELREKQTIIYKIDCRNTRAKNRNIV
jgi:hypothetical protein